MSVPRPSRVWRYGLVAILVTLGLALAQPVQELGCTQTSQLALTRALATGTARIDRWQQSTCDKAWFRGHYYSVKAPGLATAAVPVYLFLRETHLLPATDRTTIWLLALFTVLPAALLLVFSTARAAEFVEPAALSPQLCSESGRLHCLLGRSCLVTFQPQRSVSQLLFSCSLARATMGVWAAPFSPE